MEQLNRDLPEFMEESVNVVRNSIERKSSSVLLDKVRLNFRLLVAVSLTYGLVLAFCFYQAGFGLNMFLFALVTICLLWMMLHKISGPIKRGTKVCYLGVILLGLSTMLTASEILQFLNVLGMLLLLDLSILHQLNEDHTWIFSQYLMRIIVLPFTCMTTIHLPFLDSYENLKKSRLFRNKKVLNVFLGIVLTIPLLIVIVFLLTSADLLFRDITKEIVSFFFSPDIFYVSLMIMIGFFVCYCVICGSTAKAGVDETHDTVKKADASIAVTVLTILCLVYVLFCSIQILYLFSKGLFVLPEEFTFSEYARRGFFELLAVTVINILLMLICTTRFQESKAIRLLLTCMTACTYIMIGSAFYRMLLYIGEYQLTFLRLFVLLFLSMDAFLLGGIILSVYKKSFPLFWYSVTVISLCYLLFSFAKPDYYIASYNIENDKLINEEEFIYLTRELSLDAAPVVIPYLERISEVRDKNIAPIQEIDSANEDGVIQSQDSYLDYIQYQVELRGIRDFNLSHYLAEKALNKIEE